MKRCATCWKDPATRKWHNPNPDVEPLGTSESNWICPDCYSKPVNEGWTDTPSAEVYGIEAEHADDTHAVPDSEAGPHETPTCLEIMRRYCLSQTQRSIAADVGCSHKFVKDTIKYWLKNRGYFVKTLKKSLSKKGKKVH